MKRSTNRILTTHAGSLSRPEDLIELNRTDAAHNTLHLRQKSAVSEVVRQQVDCGLDVINDGEFGKAMRQSVDYGAWWSYAYDRLSGFEAKRDASPGFGPTGSKDRADFREFYETGQSMPGAEPTASAAVRLGSTVCVGPISYVGYELIGRDINNLKAALDDEAEEAFMTAVSPATLQILHNDFYKTQQEYTIALADAIREEYRAIIDAGFVLQIDDPALVDLYDWWFSTNEDLAAYLKWVEFQVEVLNHALAGLPEDRVRFHICWGSWHGPHSSDVPLKEVVDLLIKVNAQAYSIEAGNVRHEHEWKVWRDQKLPDGKILIPGVVSHATNVLEHPELVADRIVNYASVVGKENVIAGTDCGLGGRVHPQLAWAKLRTLTEGAALATKQLWG